MTDGPVFCRLCNEPIYLEPGADGYYPAYWCEYPPADFPDACSGRSVASLALDGEKTGHAPPLDLPPATDRTSVEEWLDA